MLPPDFAAFSFRTDPAGTDEAIAARVAAAAGGGRVGVVGAARWGLLVALVRHGLLVVAFDPARQALELARQADKKAGLAEHVTLFAADPRDVVVPGGISTALCTSFAWRMLAAPKARAQVLACLRKAVAPAGRLCLDLDRLPPATPACAEAEVLRRGPGRQVWRWRRDPARGVVTVGCESPGVPGIEVDLADITPEASAAEVEAAGFRVETYADAATGSPLRPESERLWLVARPHPA